MAALGGDIAGSRVHLAAAAEAFEAMEMQLFAASARRRLASLTPGEQGEHGVRAEDARMRALFGRSLLWPLEPGYACEAAIGPPRGPRGVYYNVPPLAPEG